MDWVNDATAQIKIRADRHDQNDDDFANGLSNTLTRDGQSQPTANIPMNGKKLTNLGDPTSDQDAATKHYVDVLPGWTTSKNISGSDANGRLNFSSMSGINGISWTGADLAWLAKIGEANKTSHRLVLNDNAAGTGADKVIIDENGYINFGQYLTQNLSWDGDEWRTISPGLATSLRLVNGVAYFAGLDAATTLDPYKPAAMRDFCRVQNSGGTALLDLVKSASAKGVYLRSFTGTEQRWQIALGDTVAESSTYTGSNFSIYGYDNTGANARPYMHLDRNTRKVTFYGDVVSNQNFDSTSATCILSATSGGSIYFRPNGPTSTTEQAFIDTAGAFHISSPNAYKTTAGSWLAGSDARLKNIGQAYEHGLAEIRALPPARHFEFKRAPGIEHISLIAQDVEPIFPECITQINGEVDGRQVSDLRQFDPTNLTYALLNAVRELADQLDAANARIAALEAA
jgi:hypothetical protein